MLPGRLAFLAMVVVSVGLLSSCKGGGQAASGGTTAAAPTQSLYDLLGGEKAIRAVVDEFVASAAPDPKVNFTRQGTGKEWSATDANVATMKERLVEFVSKATGANFEYKGRDMKSLHAGMKITNAEFDALAGHLQRAMEKLGVPKNLADQVMSIAGSTRAQIVEA